ncbi:MAG: SF1B family DNA helicase RecD2 [Planctomycetota bacterium]|jgi:exodeoxyribonuclease V alpha subunit
MKITLTDEQRAAVDCVLSHNVMVLTGGPGTGKTTTCNEIIRQLEATGRSVACAAPTGKAAKRLQEQTGRPASTIHRLLAWSFETQGFTIDHGNPLSEGAVLIDEMSMTDLELAYAVLDAMRPGAKLILVGDADQLPSVSAGNVLRDIVASNTIPVIRLKEIHRQSKDSWICENARRINLGQNIHIDNQYSEDFFFVERQTPQQTAETITRLVGQAIPLKHGFDPIRDIQVLTPQKKGAIGIESLNPELQNILNPMVTGRTEWKLGGSIFREGDRVIHTRNNYQLEVFNGEVGTIVGVYQDYMRVDFGDRDIDYDKVSAMQLMLCYASTIHRAQGSEYPCVVVACHSSNYFMLSRPLFYTAVTRASEVVYIVGDRKGLNRAISNNQVVKRYTSLRERLEAEVSGGKA